MALSLDNCSFLRWLNGGGEPLSCRSVSCRLSSSIRSSKSRISLCLLLWAFSLLSSWTVSSSGIVGREEEMAGIHQQLPTLYQLHLELGPLDASLGWAGYLDNFCFHGSIRCDFHLLSPWLPSAVTMTYICCHDFLHLSSLHLLCITSFIYHDILTLAKQPPPFKNYIMSLMTSL